MMPLRVLAIYSLMRGPKATQVVEGFCKSKVAAPPKGGGGGAMTR